MKKYLFIALLFITTNCFASPPTRVASYTPNDVISSTDVTANENAIFNYLQAGIDLIADGTIVNADINSSANIQSDKLNLTSINQNIANTGTFANTGNATVTGDLVVTGTLNVTGAATLGSLNLLPAGTILMWNSTVATIPSGWVLCDGTNSTPDLRDKFIVGAKQDDSGTAKTNITGSLTQSGGSTTISQANIPSYNLTVTAADANGSGQHELQGTTNGASPTSYNISSGGSGTAYTQPYYALCFIQKS